MSAIAVDESFPTTFGFFTNGNGLQTTHASSGIASSGARSALSASPTLNRGLGKATLPDQCPAARPSSFGWNGLLEMSRGQVASGIVGALKGAAELHVPSQIEVCATAHTSASVRRLVKSVARGITACQEPERAAEGMGGTYFFCNENGRKVAILKPCDEEPLAPNNPKGYVGRSLGDPGWKPTVRVGEAAMREVAAYLLDRDGFAKVPTSVLVRARHPVFCYNHEAISRSLLNSQPAEVAATIGLPMKLGSLQEFVPHECDTSEMGPSRFSVKDVHRIGILDIRLFNTDRHAGNMLVRVAKEGSASNLLSRMSDSQYELVPIDHGFCLPETLEAPYFEWLHWPQAMLPFSEDELQYIRSLDIEADKDMLREQLPNLRPECLRVLELSTALLMRCAEAGMTLYEIGNIMSRPFSGADEDPSELEKICSDAKRALEMPEIVEEAEEDEQFSSSEGDRDNDEEEGIALELAGELFERRKSATGARKKQEKEDDGLIFGLEESPASHRAASFSPRPACSPSQNSIGSYSSSFSSRNTDSNVAALLSSAEPLAPVRTVAHSVHVTDAGFPAARPPGYLWRMNTQRRQQRSKRLRKPKLASPQAYPPRVVMATPYSESINFGDFDDKGWARFKQEMELLIDAHIKSGGWRLASREAVGGVAMSCPRF